MGDYPLLLPVSAEEIEADHRYEPHELRTVAFTGAWRDLFQAHPDRFLLASGTNPSDRKLGWKNHIRLLRSLHLSLQEPEYRLHLVQHGNKGEWAGYRYDDETSIAGLALPVEVVDRLTHGNYRASRLRVGGPVV